MNNYTYFYSIDGRQRGPVTVSGLKEAHVTKDTLVWRDGFEDWQKAGDVSELDEVFEETDTVEAIEASSINTDIDESVTSYNHDGVIDNTKMFKNAFFFKGRARRTEFCLAFIAYYICLMIPFLFGEAFGDSSFAIIIGLLIFLGGFWFFLSESVRRCHDLGHNGFWILIPYYILWLMFQNSKVGSNEYGNNPKGENFKRLY